jgi:hypothetical protein
MPNFAAVDPLLKGMQAVGHQLTLLTLEVQHLREAKEALSKRRNVKRTRLQNGGVIDVSQARQLMVDKGVVDAERRDEEENEDPSKRRRTGSRQCGICRKTSHNSRTCLEAALVDISNDYD